MTWKSRHNYRDEKGRIGKIVYSDPLGRYLLKSAGGSEYMINQDFAKKCHETEEQVNGEVGRPSLFPNEPKSAKLITLSDRLWEKLGEPYSSNIAKLLED